MEIPQPENDKIKLAVKVALSAAIGAGVIKIIRDGDRSTFARYDEKTRNFWFGFVDDAKDRLAQISGRVTSESSDPESETFAIKIEQSNLSAGEADEVVQALTPPEVAETAGH